jgi:hypothetical protein
MPSVRQPYAVFRKTVAENTCGALPEKRSPIHSQNVSGFQGNFTLIAVAFIGLEKELSRPGFCPHYFEIT